MGSRATGRIRGRGPGVRVRAESRQSGGSSGPPGGSGRCSGHPRSGLASRSARRRRTRQGRLVGGRWSRVDDWDGFHTWVDTEVNTDARRMRGNREKLRKAVGDESHAVIGVTMNAPWPAHRAPASDSRLPSMAPLLPQEFTHIWLIGDRISDRCLAWYPDLGWFDPTRITCQYDGHRASMVCLLVLLSVSAEPRFTIQ